jgi:hypothetical protein
LRSVFARDCVHQQARAARRAAIFRGQLDILQPHYQRIYLMAAYRYLTGIGLDKADQQALLAKPTVPDYWGDRGSPAMQAWLQVRVQVGAPPSR